jgi:hypothetical protein
VLAAVDAHVARHLFGPFAVVVSCGSFSDVPSDHVIGPDGLLSRTARVLSTNSVQFLDLFTHIIFMRRGEMVERGSFQDLVSNHESHIHMLTCVLLPASI